MGRQKYSAYIIFVGNWLITIPLSAMWVFAYMKGIKYVWGMKALGTATIVIGHATLLMCTNWDKLIADAQERLQKTKNT